MRLGFIYFLRRADGLIKIGYTSDFSKRQRHLTKAHGPLEVIRVINGDKLREQRLHYQFEALNQFGEWFRDDGRIVELIHALPDGDEFEVFPTEAKRRFAEGEHRLVAEASRLARELIKSRGVRLGISTGRAAKLISSELGISFWIFETIVKGRGQTISAHALDILRRALPKELLEHRDELMAEVHAVENDLPSPMMARLEAAKSNQKAARAMR